MGALQAQAGMTAEEYFASTPETKQHVELRSGEIVYFASPTAEHQNIVLGLVIILAVFMDVVRASMEAKRRRLAAAKSL